MKTYYSWGQFDEDCAKIAKWAKERKFQNIYGIPRGGLIVAVRLSHLLNLPVSLSQQDITPRTLIVDDICDTGTTLKKLQNIIPKGCTVATIFWHKQSPKPDFYCKEKESWVIFPWETEQSSRYDNTV